MSLETTRLTLVPSAPRHLLALIQDPPRFDELIGVPAADGLHEFFTSAEVSPAWLAQLSVAGGPDPWHYGFFAVERAQRSVIGSAGFKGPPDGTGTVEIAYGVVPGHQGRGYATEAAAALLQFAFAHEHVRCVRAHTSSASGASARVLEKCGFRQAGLVVDPEDGPVWRWERHREPLDPGPSQATA